MHAAEDKNLKLIESELRFISRHVQTVECNNGRDFQTVEEVGMAIEYALRALFKYKLSLEPEVTEDAAGVALAA